MATTKAKAIEKPTNAALLEARRKRIGLSIVAPCEHPSMVNVLRSANHPWLTFQKAALRRGAVMATLGGASVSRPERRF